MPSPICITTFFMNPLNIGTVIDSFSTRSRSITSAAAHPLSQPWVSLFAAIVWLVWKRRCSFIFTDKCCTMQDILRYEITCSSHFTPTSHASLVPQLNLTMWRSLLNLMFIRFLEINISARKW
ncbi:hypothetical protein V6N13_132232 [Hibiscus sabdariffa]